MAHRDKDLQPALNTSRTIAVVASALGLLCACGLGPSGRYQPPPPDLVDISANTLSFTSTLGKPSAPQHFSIANVSQQTITLSPQSNWMREKNSPFTLQTDCVLWLAPNTSCTVTITFLPLSERPARIPVWLNFQKHEDHMVWLEGHTDHSQP